MEAKAAANRETPPVDAGVDQLLERLRGGWTSGTTGLVYDLLGYWHKQLATSVSVQSTLANGLCFTCNLSKIRLLGTDAVWCVLLSGHGPDLSATFLHYWSTVFAAGRLLCVLALSDEAYAVARERRATSTCILAPSQVAEVLTQPDARQVLKAFLREQIPPRALIPFDIGVSANETMFYGRRSELRKLLEDGRSCFAIAGPSRIGKTTLVKAYLRHLKHEQPLRHRSAVLADLYECSDRSDHGVLRFIAKRIALSRWAERVTEYDFVGFLKYHERQLGQPLDLIIDEADDICQRPVVDELLRAAVGQKLCRLIFCGRGALFKAINTVSSPFAGRVKPVHLQPLSAAEAQALLVEPLTDLGFRIDAPEILEVVRLTGRLPHLLQWYGQRLAELAIDDGARAITREHLETLRWDHSMATQFTGTINELATDEAKLVALTLLKSKRESFTPTAVYEIVRPEAEISHGRIPSICDELVMQNILTWDAHGYRIASGALAFYAEQLGLLDGELDEARQAVRRARGVSSEGRT